MSTPMRPITAESIWGYSEKDGLRFGQRELDPRPQGCFSREGTVFSPMTSAESLQRQRPSSMCSAPKPLPPWSRWSCCRVTVLERRPGKALSKQGTRVASHCPLNGICTLQQGPSTTDGNLSSFVSHLILNATPARTVLPPGSLS